MKITHVEVNLSALEKKAREIEHIAHQLKEMEGLSKEKSEELKYIG
jgi:proteasome assembly chaperone (PAC2) family protein